MIDIEYLEMKDDLFSIIRDILRESGNESDPFSVTYDVHLVFGIES